MAIARTSSLVAVLLGIIASGADCRSNASSQPSTQAADPPPVVRVSGKEARYDLGQVAPNSEHLVTFEVENPTDHLILIKRAQGDCDCVKATQAPDRIEPRSTARFTAKYTAPTVKVPYESALILMTDDPARKVITLRIRSISTGK